MPARRAPSGGLSRVWPGDVTGGTALVRPSARSDAGLEGLRESGFVRARTGAISHREAQALMARGWRIAAHLHLLTHPLGQLPPEHPREGPRLRRAGEPDVDVAVALDDEVFPEEWRLGRAGLIDALRATAQSRFRMARDAAGPVGFAICGRSGTDGYVQRLAVAAGHRREGLGRALTLDGLRWLKRWRATTASVNTFVGNEAALRLYRSLGFVEVQPGLMVLTIDL